MSFYSAPIDLNLDCFGPEVAFTEVRPAFRGTSPEEGFVAGKARFSRSRTDFSFTIAPLTKGEVEDLRHVWRQTNGGCRPVLVRLPGNQGPVHAVLDGPLIVRQRTAAAWACTLSLRSLL